MNPRMLRILFVLAAAAIFTGGCAQEKYDIVIGGGTVIDGTGSAGYAADIGIREGRIAAIGKFRASQAGRWIDAAGKIVAPGFIDIHTHGDRGILHEEGRKAQNYVMQGVTTIVTGNCGNGTFKVAEYFALLEEQGSGINIAHLVGHGTVRGEVMRSADRAPTNEEMQQMRSLVDAAMKEGAAGLSSGLFYAPGSFAETGEVVELAKVVREHNGIYTSHIRDESNYTTGLKASIAEAIEVGEKAGVPVQISHIKGLGKPVWGMAEEVCGIIEAAQARGVKVYADQYPYNASGTGLVSATIPRWVQAEGKTSERLKDPKLLPRIRKETAENIERRGGPETLVISSFRRNPEWEGKNLLEISEIMGKNPVDTAIEMVLMGGAGVVSFNMSEEDIDYFMRKPWVMTGSDGDVVLRGQGMPHPRSYGAFPRKIRTYAIEKKIISVEQAIRSATGLPADMLGFKDRGLIREGYAADVVVFHPESIRDAATYTQPHQYSEGIECVLINGVFAVDAGSFTGALAGKPLRRDK